MRILAVISGEYGRRHVENIRKHGAADWKVEEWQAPAVLPPVIDYPEDYLPDTIQPTDLILSFGENRGIAELLPEIAKMSGARSVIAPIDNEAWLPRGLARQLRSWLNEMGVACVTPKPLCSLTENDYGVTRRIRQPYQDALIAEFAQLFGEPKFQVSVDPKTRTIISIHVQRDTVCGCARYVAEGLLGVSVEEAEGEAGLLHHHYPCLASMGIDSDFDDTLMHVSGNILKDKIGEGVKPFKHIQYITPGKRGE